MGHWRRRDHVPRECLIENAASLFCVPAMQDRYAAGRSSPSIDEQQDWELEFGEEEGGYTILEFSRKYTTCDDFDRPIAVR